MADDLRNPVFAPDDGDDDVLRRVRATLAPLPPRDAAAVARVLSAVHGRAPSRWNSWSRAMAWVHRPGLAFASGGALLAATVIVILIARDFRPAVRSAVPPGGKAAATRADSLKTAGVAVTTSGGSTASRDSPSGAPLQAASTAAAMEAAVPVQFVLDAATAASVSVVGDFNDWNAGASPMQRLPGSGVWTATLPMIPGRHVYAFIVDGKTWTRDPRAPRAPDSDFGKPGSVLLVVPR